MDILLVNAVSFSLEDNLHIGQFVLRDILKKNYEVDCVNFDLLNKQKVISYLIDTDKNIEIMGNYILQINPKVVGFYTICNSFVIAYKLAEFIKKKNKNITIFFGGPQASVVVEECLHAFPYVDYICIGESEYSITSLMDAIMGKINIHNVPGIAFRENGEIVKTNPAPLIKGDDLGNYVVHDYSPFNIDKDMIFPIEGGRGCPFSCTFCTTSTFWKRTFRVKPVNVLIQEMKYFNHKFGVHNFIIHHDMFTANRAYISEFCDKLKKENLGFEWRCSSRVDVLDEEIIDKMKSANCVDIFLGIETGSQRMQKIINKHLNLNHAMRIIRYIASKDISVSASFMYCFPDETIDDFRDTIKMIQDCFINGVTVALHRFVMTPSTIETQKVINRMYLDLDTIVPSHKYTIEDKKSLELIKEYPNMFSQYYTFDSLVIQNYKNFNLLLDIIIVMDKFFHYTLYHLIQEHGLEKIYLECEDGLNSVNESMRNEDMSMRISCDKRQRYMLIYNMFKPLFEKMWENKSNSIMDSELFNYEKLKYITYATNQQTSKVYKFLINIPVAYKKNEIIQEDYYIRMYLDNEILKVKHVIEKTK
nr:radical SAM protein [uncultured Anaerosporobacter sp.]